MLMIILTSLPEKLLDVKHIFPSWLEPVFKILFFFLLLFILLSCLRLFQFLKNRTTKAKPKTAKRKTASKSLNKKSALRKLNKILKDTEKTEGYRQGAHEISALIKAYLEIRLKTDVEELTTTEITYRINKKDVTAFFQNLSELQFQPKEPKSYDIANSGNRAKKIIAKYSP